MGPSAPTIPDLPAKIDDEMQGDEAFLRALHFVLLDVHLEEGCLIARSLGANSLYSGAFLTCCCMTMKSRMPAWVDFTTKWLLNCSRLPQSTSVLDNCNFRVSCRRRFA